MKMSELNTVVTGQTDHLIEDVPAFQEHQFIRQARSFMKSSAHPITYYDAVRKSLPMVHGVEHKTAMQLLGSIEVALINAVDEELKAANQVRMDGDTKATKPRELYVKYGKVLLTIIERGTFRPKHHEPILTTIAVQAQFVYIDLYSSTSLSDGDLVSPDYIDAYTGETIIEANDAGEFFDKLVQHSPSINPMQALLQALEWDATHHNTDTPIISMMSDWEKEIRQCAKQAKRDLGWSDRDEQNFINAQLRQGGYDADSDDIPLVDDDTDSYTPPTLLPNELVLNKELWWGARDAVREFNKARALIFKEMGEAAVSSRAWRATFRSEILKSPSFDGVIAAIEKAANEDVVTGAAIYLSLAGDYGLMRDDVQGIHGLQTNSAENVKVDMLQFADAWEDDLLNLTQDALSPMSETCPHDYKDMIDLPEYRATMPTYHPNPLKTAAYNIGFTRAAMAGADWRKADDAGWEQWRLEMDPKAAQAYDAVFAKTKSRGAAMQAFWNICDKRVPRPQDKFVAVLGNKSGLRISTASNKREREINWGLVAIKLRNNELDFIDEDGSDRRPKLLAKLQELGIGQKVWDLLK
jgi:hypothetical protein